MSRQQQNLRTAADEVRRRANNVQRPLSSSSNSSAIDSHYHQHHGGIPGIDPSSGGGWTAGFNGVVFGSGGGGDIAGLPGLLGTAAPHLGANSSNVGLSSRAPPLDHHLSTNADHAAPQLSTHHQVPRLNSSIVMEHIVVLQRENAQLRRQNQTLVSATNTRRQTAVKLLREIVNNDDGNSTSSNSSSRSSLSGNSPSKNDLTSLLLSLLDASDPDTIEDGQEEAANEPPAPSATAAAAASAPVTRSTRDTAHHNNVPQRSATPRSATAVTSDWDRDALADISRQGKVAKDEPASDEYLLQKHKALGQRGPFALGRRSTMTMPARRRPSTASTHSFAAEPEKETSHINVSHPGAYPADGTAETTAAPAYDYSYPDHPEPTAGIGSSPLHDDAKLGPLAASLMSHKAQFVKRPDTRFTLYSPSAGLFESHTLEGLRSGDMTLADIIEASSRCMSLDILRKERILERESVAVVDKMATQSQSQQHQQSTEAAVDDSASCKSTSCDDETELLIRSRRKSEPQKHQLPVPQPMSRQQSAAPAPAISQNGNGCFWLDVTSPTNEEMASLARTFGIHPLTVEDIMADEDGRDKFETFSGYNFLVYRTIDYGEDAKSNYEFNRGAEGIATASFSLILKHSCVLTFHQATELEHVGNVINRLHDLVPLPSILLGDNIPDPDESAIGTLFQPVVTPAYIAYALIDDITDTIAPEMRAIELEVDAVDELVLILSTNEQSDMLRRIGAARRKILTVWRLLQGKPEVIRAFSKLMERQALADDVLRADAEDAEYTRKVIMDSAVAANANIHGAGGKSLPPNHLAGLGAFASQTQLLHRSAHSSTAIHQLAASTSGRRRDAQQQQQPSWPTYITGGSAPIKDRIPMASSTRPSTVDLVNLTASGQAGAGHGPGGIVTADEVSRYLSDVYDHLVSLIGSSSHCDMVLSRAHSNYLARLSLELGESTVETNVFASRWTVIGAILVPLNVVTGLWGMNVQVPGEGSGSLREFFLILGGCVAFVVAVITWAKFKKIF
ncbi:CorA metal ion transporter [Coemansia sp. RSA 1813]|nr:CorA metal ion transporter [Coemansia sp. RSA 1646]KAJ1771290.1 CorA metal ion transporter [Coemansia sp. RSA 1843]KAJ2088944.1 CorA metal ion transporter [Coemansia sp. RSA 986]KAJ2213249.1 CorA metal ion transporter [Coemansia sp. RSA 487]KAJ2569515.1 CorA metal ion transporter [Coemansia sp. RSA 1813]